MELMIIFWYGVLHAFGPDHLSAIADFSIGKERKRTLLVTLFFALGHGVMLFVFAKLLEEHIVAHEYLQYADTLAAMLIAFMGAYLLLTVALKRVHLKKHMHNEKEHIHIWFGSEHSHSSKSGLSALGIGALMGIGGARGMVVVLSVAGNVSFEVVGAFVIGVSVVFLGLGLLISIFNSKFLGNITNVRRTVFGVGGVSLLVGLNMLAGV